MSDATNVNPAEPATVEAPESAMPEVATPEVVTSEVPTPASRRRAAPAVVLYAILVILAWTGLELWGLGKAPFHTKGEPREGLVVWEMTHHGSWILPRRDGPTGLEVPSKPPLFHWLGAITSFLHGTTDEWSIRLPSAALSLTALLCIFAAGAALWNPQAGLFSALALMTMFEWARAATGARVDMTLTFGLQLAFLSLLFFLRSRASGWLIPLYLGVTLAVLGKGPVGIALPGLVALVMLALTRDLSFLRRMRLGYGACIVAIFAGSWYVMALILGGWQFFHKQVLAENVFTFLDNKGFGGGHRHAVTYLLGALLLGLMPWTIFLPGITARLWRQRRQLSLNDPRLSLLAWIGVVFAFYALAASKRSVYLLSLYPAVALLLGWWGDEQSRAFPNEERWLARLVPFVGWPLTMIVCLIFIVALFECLGAPVLSVAQGWLPVSGRPYAPWISETLRSGRWALFGLLLAAAVFLHACIRFAARCHWAGILASLFCATAALIVSVNLVFLPGIARHESFRAFMTAVRQAVGPEGGLCFFETFEYGAVFYWQDHIPNCKETWSASAPRYRLMEKEAWERIRASVRDQYEQVNFADGAAAESPLVLVRRIGQ